MTRADMQQYQVLAADIALLDERLATLAAEAAKISIDRVRGSLPEYPFSECGVTIEGFDIQDAERRKAARERLLARKQAKHAELEAVRGQIEEAIEGSDLMTQRVVWRIFVEGASQKYTAHSLGLTPSAVNKRLTRFFQEVNQS